RLVLRGRFPASFPDVDDPNPMVGRVGGGAEPGTSSATPDGEPTKELNVDVTVLIAVLVILLIAAVIAGVIVQRRRRAGGVIGADGGAERPTGSGFEETGR